MSSLDWLQDSSALPDPHDKGERAVQFVKRLRLHEGAFAGRPFPLASWQERLIRRIYGDTKEDGTRRIRKVFILLPRANGKTTLCAALGLLHLLGPESEAAGQVVAAAADREQASIAFNAATAMIRNSPTLTKITKVAESNRRITHRRSGSRFTAISHEVGGKHGLSISCLIADEIHAWPKRALWDVLTQSMGKREQPLTIAITTAGCGVHGLAHELYDYAKKVASGEVEDETFLPVIFEAPADCDWQDEDVWKAVNPAIASGFRRIEEMRETADMAAEIPAQREAFKRFYLNIWSDGAPDPWLDLSVYDDGAAPVEVQDGDPCWVGVDLASVEDLAAVVAAFRTDRGYELIPRFYVPQETLRKRQERDQIPYLTWAEEGWITPTPGNVVDYTIIEDDILKLAERYRVLEVPIDRWNATGTINRLTADGLPVNLFGQGNRSMTPAMKEVERAVLSRQIIHGGNPVLRWCFGNVAADVDPAGNIKPNKAKSAEKIDGAVAAIMAIARASSDEIQPSVYEDRGFITL